MTDITCIGEVLIDLTQTGTNAHGVPQFSANPGGAPANVAVAASRLGAAPHSSARPGGTGSAPTFAACSRKTASRPTAAHFGHTHDHGDRLRVRERRARFPLCARRGQRAGSGGTGRGLHRLHEDPAFRFREPDGRCGALRDHRSCPAARRAGRACQLRPELPAPACGRARPKPWSGCARPSLSSTS